MSYHSAKSNPPYSSAIELKANSRFTYPARDRRDVFEDVHKGKRQTDGRSQYASPSIHLYDAVYITILSWLCLVFNTIVILMSG